MSIMRPGVQTTISVPRLSSEIWLATPEPPYTMVHVSETALANLRTSCILSQGASGFIILILYYNDDNS